MFYHFSRDSFITHLTRNGPLFYRTTATKKQPSLGNVSPINLLTLVPICKYRKRTWKLFTDLSESLFSVSLVGLRSAAVFDIKMFVVLILWLESGAGDWATLSPPPDLLIGTAQSTSRPAATHTDITNTLPGAAPSPSNELSVLGHWRRLIHPFLPKSLSGEYRVGVTSDDRAQHWGLELHLYLTGHWAGVLITNIEKKTESSSSIDLSGSSQLIKILLFFPTLICR